MNDPSHLKRNALLLIASMGAGAALIWWLGRPQPDATHSSVVIKDGQTIDFSSGKPVVTDSAKDKAIIDAAVKEMDEAARHVTFSGSAAVAPSDTKKKTEAPIAPPSQK